MNIRTFDESDWAGFAGASCFPNGDDPLMGDDGGDWLIISDGEGSEVYRWENVDEEPEVWMLSDIVFPTAVMARRWMATVKFDAEDLAATGWERTNV